MALEKTLAKHPSLAFGNMMHEHEAAAEQKIKIELSVDVVEMFLKGPVRYPRLVVTSLRTYVHIHRFTGWIKYVESVDTGEATY